MSLMFATLAINTSEAQNLRFHRKDTSNQFKTAPRYTGLELKVAYGSHVPSGIKSITEDTLKSIYMINHKSLLIIDSLGVYNVKRFNPNYVLLRDSPKVNLNRLIDSINPQLVIADGSNYKSYISRWEATCEKRKLPFYQTGKKGAFIIDYTKIK